MTEPAADGTVASDVAADGTPADGTDVRSNDDLTQAAAAGLRWVAYARLVVEVVLFASLVWLAHLIPPSAFGLFAVIVIVQELSLRLPFEGIGGAIVQRKHVRPEHYKAGLALNILVALVLMALTAAVAVLAVRPGFGREAELLMLAVLPSYLLGAFYAISTARLRRDLDFRRLSILDLVLNTFRSLGSLVLALIGLNASALVFGSVGGFACAVVLGLYFAPVPMPRWNGEAVRDLLPYGAPAGAATFAWTGFRNGDYAVIGAVLGAAPAGLYWRAYQLAVEYQGKVGDAMAQIAFPVLARTTGIKELHELRQRMVQLLAVMVFPLLAALLVLAPAVIPWMFGAEWADSVRPTQILVFGGAATLAINAAGSALMASGRARALLGFGVAHFFVYVGTVLIVAHDGLAAVAIAGSAIHLLFVGVAYIVLLRGDEPRPLLVMVKDFAPAVVSSLGLIAVAVPLVRGLEGIGAPVPLLMAAVAVLGGIAYVVVLRVVFPRSARDLGLVVRRLLPSRVIPARFGRLAPAGS
jgi:lipopolysaccharide exporter